ncbi:hypothetical protein Cus16_1408 [Curtobacterium sp. ER1/6]|nr:hypothetical protein Cus16_1408 [Curtobacterium sp. ER1/6]
MVGREGDDEGHDRGWDGPEDGDRPVPRALAGVVHGVGHETSFGHADRRPSLPPGELGTGTEDGPEPGTTGTVPVVPDGVARGRGPGQGLRRAVSCRRQRAPSTAR